MNAEPLHCEILDEYGNVESAAIRYIPIECFEWFREHKIAMSDVALSGDTFTYRHAEAQAL